MKSSIRALSLPLTSFCEPVRLPSFAAVSCAVWPVVG